MEEKSKSVIKDLKLPRSMDYQLLRKEAITNTQLISGDNWTDYNIHDPGVTILEQFCYALTDIAYRTNLSIETLLFHGGDPDKIVRSNALYSPEEIFPSSPITAIDYRILILDNFPDKISNCWVNIITDHKEGILGLYDITLLFKSDVSTTEYGSIKNAVRELFIANRNLCEDIHEIKILESERICLSAEIDIYQDEDADEILSEILFEVESYFNPQLHFYTLDELEKKGWRLDQIFDIPSFKHGFITPEQLKSKPKEFYASKIADHILKVKGVRGLRNLSITQGGIPIYGDTIRVDDNKYLTLGLLKDQGVADRFKGFNISLYKGGIINNYLKDAVIYALEIKEAKANRKYEIQTKGRTYQKSNVKTAELVSYESIQKSFPGIYGVGDYTPSQKEGPSRLAQSNQLKAYLMFFDQLMANHLAQLSKISELFSIEQVDTKFTQTHFAQLLNKKISGVSTLLKQKLPPISSLRKRKEELEKTKSSLSDKELLEIENIELDIEAKRILVDQLVNDLYDSLIKLSEEQIKKSKSLNNRAIFKNLVEIKRLAVERALSDNDANWQDEFNRKEIEVKNLIKVELEEQEHDIELAKRHLDEVIFKFDNASERKNRILSHMLGRFGERFTTDFHIKFSSLMDGESKEHIDKKLIELKSAFLKEIVSINRFRSRAINYLNKNAALEVIPLKRKISLLLNLPKTTKKGLASSTLRDSLKSKTLKGDDIEEKNDNKTPYVEPKKKNDKITFLINSSSYYTYLFKYGLKEKNYKIERAEGKNKVLFVPPTGETPTLLFSANSKEEAHHKIESLIKLLSDLNAKSEGFHIVEHILLRPLDSSDCYFTIKSKDQNVIFKSREARPEEVQSKQAIDALLLGCYPNNYRILQNPKKEYVVIIKNSIGVELAKSTASYLTEGGAQNFIEESMSFFNDKKESGELDQLYQLDNQKKYFFDIINEKGALLFKSTKALGISEQEQLAENLIIYTLNPACYEVVQNNDHTFLVALNDYESKQIAHSHQTFKTAEEAEKFIDQCLKFFEKINSTNAYKSIIRFRRADGRNADIFNSQLSIVYSGWSSRFHNQEFIQLFKQTLFNCAPAHLFINMVGLNFQNMRKFEKVYFKYMDELPNANTENLNLLSNLSNEILSILNDKNQIFS